MKSIILATTHISRTVPHQIDLRDAFGGRCIMYIYEGFWGVIRNHGTSGDEHGLILLEGRMQEGVCSPR